MRNFVLDTSALYEGKPLPDGEDTEFFTTPQCAEEMRKKEVPNIEFLLESRIIVAYPSEESLNRVDKAAKMLGESDRLSPEDKGVIALAIDKNAVLLTDDYSIQNLCSSLKIEYFSTGTDGIRELWRWEYRCTGCGRYFPDKQDVCPVCGSPLKPVKAGRKQHTYRRHGNR